MSVGLCRARKNPLEEVGGLAKHQWDSDEVLESERQGSSDAPLEISPLEDRRPVGLAFRSRQPLRRLYFLPNDSVLVGQVVTFDFTYQSLECVLRLGMIAPSA